MQKTEFIRARIEPKLKRKVEGLFSQLGLSATEAITLFYKQVALNKGIPFPIKIPNAETEKVLKETDQGKNLTQFESAEELFEDLDI